MRRLAWLAAAVACAGCATAGSWPGEAGPPRILVTFAAPAAQADLAGAPSRYYRQRRGYRMPDELRRAIREVGDEYALRSDRGWLMESLSVYCEVYRVEGGRPLDELLESLAADPRIESAQPMQQFEVRGSASDPYRSLQHNLELLELEQAHRWSVGRGVTVAVIDTGVDAAHPDLAGRVAKLVNFMEDGERDRVPERHGTAVAGLIASNAGNRVGIVGTAPGASLLGLRACRELPGADGGRCNSFTLARALDYAIGRGADVVNLSLTGPRDPLLERLVQRALAQRIVVVGAADPEGAAGFPGSVAGVVAVEASEAAGDTDGMIRAPGHGILTLVPPDTYDFLSGNSLAAAQVSGVVALLLEGGRLDPAEVGGLLRSAKPGPVSACAALERLGRGEGGCRGSEADGSLAVSAVTKTSRSDPRLR